MSQFEVTFSREGKHITVPEHTTLLEAERMAGLSPNAPCGGQGSCGKCRVSVTDTAGSREALACQTKITGSLTVDTGLQEKAHAILTGGSGKKLPLVPLLRQKRITVPKMKLGDSLSQWERLKNAMETAFGEPMDYLKPDLPVSSCLYDYLKESDSWYVTLGNLGIISMTQEPVHPYGVAVDIGTTTVVGFLLDLDSGTVLSTESRINPQTQYGADVIMRADYALEHGTEALSTCIRRCLQEIIDGLSQKAEISAENIQMISVVGNTCMHHLLLGLSPASLSHAPYNPVIRESVTVPARELDLHIHPRGEVLLLPNIAGFVGADTVGCLLSTRPDLRDGNTLMIDIGTNGEMVLGSFDRLVTCSTAAGPAFEGAKIECGMRGASGAVDHVSYKNGNWSYTTVGGEKAVGICGSGLIDLVASLLDAGLVDESGRLETADDSSRFVLVSAENSGTGEPIYISQKDIREVQLAKAAIAAGISLMLRELGLSESDVEEVAIAGAFGNYMDPASACRIGLIPISMKNKIRPIGNAAGEGARIALLNRYELAAGEKLAAEIGFVELASSPDFQDCFVDELEFPEP